MDHGIEHVPTGCLAATSQVANCQENSNGFLTFNFHFGIFRSFSNATLSQIAILALLLLAAALAVFSLIFARSFGLKIFVINSFTHDLASSFKTKLSHWLAWHQNSPTKNFVATR
ncbi:MAG: hypothetical protein A2729_00905 [Candidatus Buchananbacteria bacterium RIFCSPHIGHO2_01_FULL_39_14]|nr:MAG: hypothetical protein A2729_00905 [Candidatus Buchananbacteria bacterium RIFCSPHIGHO2_01_FULL_39_14]